MNPADVEIYQLEDLQTTYRIDPIKILEFAKQNESTVIGEFIYISKIRVSDFLALLQSGLNSNSACHKGAILLGKELYYDALLKYEEGKKGYDILGCSSEKVICLNNIGLILETLENYPEAMRNYKEALLIVKGLGDKLKISTQLENVGRMYKKQEKYKKALKLLNKSYSILSQIKLEDYLSYIKENLVKEIEELKNKIGK